MDKDELLLKWKRSEKQILVEHVTVSDRTDVTWVINRALFFLSIFWFASFKADMKSYIPLEMAAIFFF